MNIEDAIEDGLSFVENAIIKARHASKISGKPAIADDSGICVPVLGGAPGFTLRAMQVNMAMMPLTMPSCLLTSNHSVKRVKPSKGMFVCVLALVQHAEDPLPQIFQGIWTR